MNKIRINMTGIDVKLLTLILFSILMFAQPGYSQDTANPSANIKSADSISKGLQIDTVVQQNLQSVQSVIDTVKSVDSLIAEKTPENAMTNTKLFIYILLSVLGLALFFFIFVITLFKTFHKKKSTRQSLLLSWNLFFIVSIIWLFIVWGLVAGFWTVASFMIVMIFLFIISLIMTIIALKSK